MAIFSLSGKACQGDEDPSIRSECIPPPLHSSWSVVAMNPAQAVERSASRLYRDCLRLVDHIASKSPKGQQLRLILRTEFKKNVGETDPAKIEQLKGNAIRGLSNYLVHESGSNDPQLKKRMDAVKTHALSDLKQHGQGDAPR